MNKKSQAVCQVSGTLLVSLRAITEKTIQRNASALVGTPQKTNMDTHNGQLLKGVTFSKPIILGVHPAISFRGGKPDAKDMEMDILLRYIRMSRNLGFVSIGNCFFLADQGSIVGPP